MIWVRIRDDFVWCLRVWHFPLHLLVSELARPASVSCPLPHGAVGQSQHWTALIPESENSLEYRLVRGLCQLAKVCTQKKKGAVYSKVVGLCHVRGCGFCQFCNVYRTTEPDPRHQRFAPSAVLSFIAVCSCAPWPLMRGIPRSTRAGRGLSLCLNAHMHMHPQAQNA